MRDDDSPSGRRDELLEASYQYVLAHGIDDLSLRPLAAAVESSPRVLLYLFGSKDGLVQAVLERARSDELGLIAEIRRTVGWGLGPTVRATWTWLADPAARPLLRLWVQTYVRSLSEPYGPWADFARRTVTDWLDILAASQPPSRRRTRTGAAERTLALAVLRGALLDLLATGDTSRTSVAVWRHADLLADDRSGPARGYDPLPTWR